MRKYLYSVLLLVTASHLYAAAPVNDTRANAILLTNTTAWLSAGSAYTNVSATADGVSGSCQAAARNVWFKFQAATTEMEIKVFVGVGKGSMQNPMLTLYDASGNPIACHSLSGSTAIVFLQNQTLTVGSTYYFSVDNLTTATGTFALGLTDAISNDLKAKAEVVNTKNWSSANLAYSNVYATPDAELAPCGTPGRNVWFKFQATTTEIDIKVVNGTGLGTILYPVLTLFDNSGIPVKCYSNSVTSGIYFIQSTGLTIGSWYYFSVDNNTTATGTFTLRVTDVISNDLKEKALVVSTKNWASADGAFDNTNATSDAPLSTCGNSNAGKNLWYKFQATTSEIDVRVLIGGAKGTLLYPMVSLFDDSGNEVACYKTPSTNMNANLQVTHLTIGSWYYFSVDNNWVSRGTFTLRVNDVVGYDLKENAILVSGSSWYSGDAAYSNAGALSDEMAGSCGTANRNVWFKFQAGQNSAEIKLITGGSKGTMGYPNLTLYDNAGNALQCNTVNAASGTSFVRASSLIPGNWYYFSIDNTAGVAGTFSVDFKSGSPSVLDAYAFQYKYDARQRMIAKKVPGADWVYMVYDNRDRLVLTQDGNQRTDASGTITLKNWLFTKYDVMNRPVLTGMLTTDVVLSQADMQARVNDYYNALATNGGAWFENTNGTVHGYTNNSYPLTDTLDNYLTVTYYDNYDFKTQFGSTAYDFKTNDLPADATHGYPGQVTTLSGTIGLVTGTKVKSLTGNTWLKTVNYYDDKYRAIQQVADNPKGHTLTTTVYDFVGKVLRTKSSLYQQPVSWTHLTGAEVQGNNLVSTSTAAWGSGATSAQLLPATTDGWTEATVGQVSPTFMIGLGDQYGSAYFSYIDYAWYVYGNSLRVYESGTSKWTTGSVYPGDVLRVERVNATIYYKRNGVVQYTSTVPSTTSLMTYVSFNGMGAKFSNGRLSSTFPSTALTATSSFTKRFDYDHAGRLLKTWHQTDAQPEVLLSMNIYNELGQLIDKKLYNTDAPETADNQRTFKQSVDYRYNIRGWLTSINNSTLTSDGVTNDDTGDFFGMNLNYEKSDPILGSTSLFNGNISGMKWSSGLGLGDTKEQGYTFAYDPLNRLTDANSRMNKTNVWQPGNYHENTIQYDLNGNIKKLKRNGDGGALIDDLTYDFGTGLTASNKLLSVTDNVSDATDKAKGFSDGNTTGNDYSYDANGNMVVDKNKGITTTMLYNHFNLPVNIVKGNSNLGYQYDATGMKLGQVTTYGTTQKFTEYIGPWVFENNELQFLQHDEGRIMLSAKHDVYLYSCDAPEALTPTANVTLSAAPINDEKYIKVVPTTGVALLKQGVTLGTVFPVVEGERYTLRVKGYNNTTVPVNLYVQGNSADLVWPGAALPYTPVNEAWTESSFTIPTGVTQISAGVRYSASTAAVASSFFYVNEIELYKKTTIPPEYQYNLKDHLGNVRVTFTTKDEQEQNTATLEAANANDERVEFLRYDNARRVNHYLFDHTNGSSPTTTNGAAQRLSGQGNEIYGLAKSLSVMPGDVIDMEVYAKYVDSNSTNRTTALTTLISQIASGTATAGTVIDGSSYGTSTSTFPFPGGLNGTGNSAGDGPKAYLNWLVFDRDYNLILCKSGYQRMTTDARETGQDVAHEKLTGTVIIGEAGYVYIYLSNEEETPLEVYFDDFKVTQSKSPVIAMNDFYPFGLTFNNSYARENSLKQDFLYNGKELQDELNLGWLDYGVRMYSPELGRFSSKDKVSEMYFDDSPYNYAGNSPISVLDIGGYFKIDAQFALKYPTLALIIEHYLPMLKENDIVRNAFKDLTGASDKDYDEMVTYGSGPWITPTQPEKGSWLTQDKNKNEYSEHSNYDPINHPDDLFIAKSALESMEEVLKNARVSGDGREIAEEMFVLTFKIMHEAAHYGVIRYTGLTEHTRREASGDEQGAVFERLSFKQFSYLTGNGGIDRGKIGEYFRSNINRTNGRGMTLSWSNWFNDSIFNGTATSGQTRTSSIYHPHKFHGSE